jgi:transposase
MAFCYVSDPLWAAVEPLLPTHQVSAKGGRPRVADRACLTGIVFVLWTGAAWNKVPQELGCGSGVTCWRRLKEWTRKGVWPKVHQLLLNYLGAKGHIKWSRAVVDSASVRAVLGGRTRVRTLRIERRTAVNAIS